MQIEREVSNLCWADRQSLMVFDCHVMIDLPLWNAVKVFGLCTSAIFVTVPFTPIIHSMKEKAGMMDVYVFKTNWISGCRKNIIEKSLYIFINFLKSLFVSSMLCMICLHFFIWFLISFKDTQMWFCWITDIQKASSVLHLFLMWFTVHCITYCIE